MAGGPLSFQDFEALWKSSVDDGYAQGFLDAGEGAGFEAFTQGFAQLVRVSKAIDTSLQALYILPWSGQTALPATGPNLATVTLTFSRTGRLNEPLILTAGAVFYEEFEPDWGVDHGITVSTGRRYTLTQNIVFQPGQQGPFAGLAVAERPGYGYNNPQPGSINVIDQPGADYSNVALPPPATLPALQTTLPQAVSASAVAGFQLVVADIANVVIPQHVGQYISPTSGTSVGSSFLAVGFRGALPPFDGGLLQLQYSISVASFTGSTGTFIVGEPVKVTSGVTIVGYLTLLGFAMVGGNFTATLSFRSGTFAIGNTITGTQSGATMALSIVLNDPKPAPGNTIGVGWRVLDWVQDWGLTVTNVLQPTGGTSATLDALGLERNLPRITGENDATYRQRIATIADVVTPNAIKRALNRTLTIPFGIAWCLREVGTPLLPGFFYGDGSSADGDFWDYDFVGLGSGVLSGTFFPGEDVTQTNAGVVTSAHAMVKYTSVGSPFVLGNAGATGQSGLQLLGFAGFSGPPLTTTAPVIGSKSGATYTPTGAWSFPSGFIIINGVPLPTKWRIWLDYLRFRAYFLVEVQRTDLGDFGFFWGQGNAPGTGGLIDFWDTGPLWPDFYDGHPVTTNNIQLQAFHSVDRIRAAGVTVEFLPSTGPCV